MKILITGAGLIGAHAAATLSDIGHDVILFDVSPRTNYLEKVTRGNSIDIRTGDMVDIGKLPEFHDDQKAVKIDMIVHTAGVIGGNARKDPYAAMRTNLWGTVELCEAARKSGVQRIVYAGTHGVYELDKVREAPFLENAPVSAHSVYGATKLSSEHVLRAFGGAFGIQVVILRFPNVYGYGEFVGGSSGGIAFQKLVGAALDGVSIPIPQNLNGRGEWLYAKDAALAIRQAVEHQVSKSFLVANVGSGSLCDEKDIVRCVKKYISGAEFVESIEEGDPRSTERFVPFDLSTARDELGYSPSFSLEDGVRDYINELKTSRL